MSRRRCLASSLAGGDCRAMIIRSLIPFAFAWPTTPPRPRTPPGEDRLPRAGCHPRETECLHRSHSKLEPLTDPDAFKIMGQRRVQARAQGGLFDPHLPV